MDLWKVLAQNALACRSLPIPGQVPSDPPNIEISHTFTFCNCSNSNYNFNQHHNEILCGLALTRFC